MDYKKNIVDAIDSKKDFLNDLAMKIHDNPELAYNEVQACAWMVEALKENGFEVESPV